MNGRSRIRMVGLAVVGAWAGLLACASFGPSEAPAADALDGSTLDAPDASPVGDAGSDAASYRAAVLADGPLVYWRMGIKTGLSIPDETGSGNDLILQGSGHVLGEPGAIGGDDDTAIGFDGRKSFAIANDPRALDFPAGAPFTVECWARRESIDGGSYFQHLLGNLEGNQPESSGYMLYVLPVPGGTDNARTALEFAPQDASVVTLYGPVIRPAEWAYYVFVYDGTVIRLHVDGTETGVQQALNPLQARTSPFTVGRAPHSNGFFWPGRIDEVAVYAKALTPAQIATHLGLGRR
jgi:hypothetical protein